VGEKALVKKLASKGPTIVSAATDYFSRGGSISAAATKQGTQY
jgi:hypothetical protein